MVVAAGDGACALPAAGTRSRRSASGSACQDGIGLQHHAILVRLAEDGGDLPLAERVVQRVLHRLHRHAQPHRRVAIDGDEGAEALVLLVGCHVGQRRRPRHRLAQPRAPARQLARRSVSISVYWNAVRLTRVPMVMSCTGWKNAVKPGNVVDRALQPGDHHRRRIALPAPASARWSGGRCSAWR